MNTQIIKTLYYFIGSVVTLLFTAQNIYAQSDWKKTGSHPDKYIMGVDSSMQHDKQKVMTIKSIEPEIEGFGSYMQNSNPGRYAGKRVRMTGYMKSKDLTDWAGFWLRVDQTASKEPLSFDNMEDRPVKGTTDWNKYAVILDVPDKASNLAFGTLLGGTGQVWFSNPVFDIVDNSVPTTGLRSKNDSEFVVITAKNCETESNMRSLNSDVITSLRFRNKTSVDVTVNWINYSGERDPSLDQIHHLASGDLADIQTFLTHPFIVTGSNGKCYGIYQATTNPSIAIIKD